MLKFVRDVLLIVGLIAVLFATMLTPAADGGAGEVARADAVHPPARAAGAALDARTAATLPR